MASYKQDVIEYVQNQGGRANVTAGEVASAVGCSEDTVYRHWTEVPGLIEQEGGEVPDRDDDDGDLDLDHDGADETADVEQGDLEPDDDQEIEQDDESDGEDLEPDDDEAKSYECGNCGADLEYLQKHCDECGQTPIWSAIEG